MARTAAASRTPARSDDLPSAATLARKIAVHALRKAAVRATEAVGTTNGGAAPGGFDALLKATAPKLPIQRAVDVAVPLDFAWERWMRLESLPEGTDCVEQIERDGDDLVGSIGGARRRGWRAEVLDERDRQSFAWRSSEGSDCAGLITFHRLSDRLTRIELNLDVVPTTAPAAVSLATHLAHRRTDNELRRLKARLELISPDVYDDENP
ncbi:MAG: hypothetical protein ACRDMX_02070 [Solirubrobacteraceae bacterium]